MQEDTVMLQNDEYALETVTATELPEGGLLSQRILHSQVFHTILRYKARPLCHRIILLFISTTAIHVKEIVEHSDLQTLAIKDDFDCHIRTACVLKQPDQQGISASPEANDAEIVVLTFKTQELLFLELLQAQDGWRFNCHSVPLPNRLSPLEEPGFLLAAEPFSRAVAVAAAEKTVIIYNLNIGFEVRAIAPLRCELIICAIAFLQPPVEDIHCASLIIAGTKNGRPQLSLYSWNTSDTSSSENFQHCYHRLGKEHGMPIHLIPLHHTGGFLLVCERTLALYQFGHDGSIRQIHAGPVPFYGIALRHANHNPVIVSCREPLWSSWTRSSSKNNLNHDIIYLIREDGLVNRISVGGNSGKLSIVTNEVIGQVNACIDRGFTAISLSPQGSERILVVGATTAHVLEFGPARMYESEHDSDMLSPVRELTPIRSISKWGPATSMAVVEHGDGIRESTSYAKGSEIWSVDSDLHRGDRLFVALNDTTLGAVSELHYGFNLCSSPVEGISEMPGTDTIWYFLLANGGFCLLCSSPWQSNLVCRLRRKTSEFDVAPESTLNASILPSTSPITLAAILQVTPTYVQILEVSVDESGDVALQIVALWSFGTILQTTFAPSAGLLLLGIQTLEGHIIQGCTISSRDREYSLVKLEHVLHLNNEPTSIAVFELELSGIDAMEVDADASMRNTQLNAAVGLTSGEIIFLRVYQPHGLELRRKFQITDKSLSVPCESLATISAPPEAFADSIPFTVVLCGRRDGSVHGLRLFEHPLTRELDISEISRWSFGVMPVHIKRDTCRQHAALVICGSNFCRMDFLSLQIDQPTITRILFDCPAAEAEWPTSFGNTVTALCLTPAGGFVYVVEGKAHFGTLTEMACVIPIARTLPGLAKRLVYSKFLKSLIVSTTTQEVHWQSRKRFLLSSIYLLDPKDINRGVHKHDVKPVFTCEPGERINDIMEWFCRRGSRVYHFVIATIQISRPDGSASGQLKYFKVQKDRSGQQTFSVAHDSREGDAVYSISQYSHDSLVYGSGKDLKMRKFKVDEGKFDKPISLHLGSPAVSISVHEPLIYVNTAGNGFLVLRQEGYGAGSLRCVLSEDRARLGISHLVLGNHNSVLISDGNCQLAHVQWPRDTQFPITLPAAKRAILPSSITKLVKADLRPPWKHCAVGTVERDILGLCSDGSLFSFSILTKPAWMLLSLVQMLCMANEDMFPYIRNRTTRLGNRGMSDAPDYHVDGDLLGRLANRRDAVQVLSAMLDNESTTASAHSVVRRLAPERRRAICEKLVQTIVEHAAAGKSNDVDGQRRMVARSGNVVEDVLRVMHAVLETPF